MNCLEFRRILLTDPGSEDPGFLAHRRSCSECTEVIARSAHFERRLREAARVEVPETLASRILLKQSFAERKARPWWRDRRVVALAASVLLAVGLASLAVLSESRDHRLSQEFVALVNGAPYALTGSLPVSDDDVSAALDPVGLDLAGSIGKVTFASRCLVRGKLAGHLVLQGESAPVTVFLVPFSLVDERARIRSAHYSGVVVPQGNGTIAIVSSPGESLEGIEERVRSAIRWQT
jgi:hypothetical protein